MSRIGKKAITLPANVETRIDETNRVFVKGPKGEMSVQLASEIEAVMENQEIKLKSSGSTRQSRAIHGLNRSLLANMIIGVTQGYERKLQINGIGYKADLKNKKLAVTAGLSHIVEVDQPDGITFQLNNPQLITISGIDKELVGRIAAKIRSIRPAEPYNGKGIQYIDEKIKRKAGKSGK
ncbi:MAG: 50S ribosomal protein L6 [Candidatus Cloacimonetes bacterium 4572_55]|nr:MAG: 50S ribosomal protein L6 [Candidatus Cloacimonetes bacterium 4572_55]